MLYIGVRTCIKDKGDQVELPYRRKRKRREFARIDTLGRSLVHLPRCYVPEKIELDMHLVFNWPRSIPYREKKNPSSLSLFLPYASLRVPTVRQYAIYLHRHTHSAGAASALFFFSLSPPASIRRKIVLTAISKSGHFLSIYVGEGTHKSTRMCRPAIFETLLSLPNVNK